MTWQRSGCAATESEQACDLCCRIRMLKDRQAEGRLGHKQIAGHQFEGLGGAVGIGLVVAGDDGASPLIFDQNLRTA